MPRLRRADCAGPGIARLRRGRGFAYRDAAGNPVNDPEVRQRISDLAIPPAWQDVWICPHPNGHIQAIGTDAAGRRQYRYHDYWRVQRDREKFDRVLEFAARLPKAREATAEHLALDGMPRERALATAFHLLDWGFFRVGGEEYAEAHGTYGLATIRREHVTVTKDGFITFEYVAKHGKEIERTLAHAEVCDAVRVLRRRRGGGEELLAYRNGTRWVDVRSTDINDYLRESLGPDIDASAKDFRTWHGTVLMAVGLAVSTSAPTSPTARRRAVNRVIAEVAHYLGNTPAVARSAYIDPRVIDKYNDGVTIARVLGELGADVDFGQPATRGPVEAAVLRLLKDAAEASERRAS
jgi:DNA topoisomerase IB